MYLHIRLECRFRYSAESTGANDCTPASEFLLCEERELRRDGYCDEDSTLSAIVLHEAEAIMVCMFLKLVLQLICK